MSDKTREVADTAFALAHFAAATSAVIVAALHRRKPIEESDIRHLLDTLSTCAANAPEASSGLFHAIAETVAGKQYEGG